LPVPASALFNVDDFGGSFESSSSRERSREGDWSSPGASGGVDEHATIVIVTSAIDPKRRRPLTTKKVARGTATRVILLNDYSHLHGSSAILDRPICAARRRLTL
jgi:hypothetical protein